MRTATPMKRAAESMDVDELAEAILSASGRIRRLQIWRARLELEAAKRRAGEVRVCVCATPVLSGGCGIDGHRHLAGECRACHRPRIDRSAS